MLPQCARSGTRYTAGAWLTIAVQLGFVAGALVSALVNLADVYSARLVSLGGALGAAAANLGLLAATRPGPRDSPPLRDGHLPRRRLPARAEAMATWFRADAAPRSASLVGELTVGSATPHLVNGLGGLDWQAVDGVDLGSALAGGLLVLAGVREGPFPFPLRRIRPAAATARVRNRRVRLARSATSGTCGSSTRCGRGSSSSPATSSTPTARDARFVTFAVIARRRGCSPAGLARRPCRPTGDDRCLHGVSGPARCSIGFVPHVAGAHGRARLGLHRGRGLGGVLDARHGHADQATSARR